MHVDNCPSVTNAVSHPPTLDFAFCFMVGLLPPCASSELELVGVDSAPVYPVALLAGTFSVELELVVFPVSNVE